MVLGTRVPPSLRHAARTGGPAAALQSYREAELLAQPWDVVIIGGGNAALVSAMGAHDEGASVLVLERSDTIFRGGNSRHTRNIRCVHGDGTPYNTGAYTHDELWKDLCGVGTG